jgi:2,4-dienoyl-CoA reductase-like NADH-dependent reductase (Old Yellow Enzyme family)/thioredoxin reductase
MSEFKHLFQPIGLGSLRVRNRLMMTTHQTGLAEGRTLRYLEERSKGGVGLIGINAGEGVHNYSAGPGRFFPDYAGDFDVRPLNPASPEGIRYYDEKVIPVLRKRAEAVHRHGAVCIGQVLHLGNSIQHAGALRLAMAPSPVPDEFDIDVPHELEVEEIAELVQVFAHGARRVKEAGLDGVEIHAAHGYLINQFLSPHANRRDDQYGGNPDKRLRFLLEILDATRELVGPSFPIGVRIAGEEFREGGLALEEVKQIARRLNNRLDYINVSGGNHMGLTQDGVMLAYVSPSYVPPGPNVPMAAAIKAVVDIPVIVAGRINDPVLAEGILADGSADMVGMARAFIADPDFANKAREGRTEDIRTCIVTNECHYVGRRRPVMCAINAAAGREAEMDFAPAQTRKLVLVVGGGPAGMEAARTAALRGHRVLLSERRTELGGNLSIIARDPNRRQVGDLVVYLQSQLKKLGVELLLGEEISPEMVGELAPDAVVLATGAEPYVPPIPGAEDERVVTCLQVLRGEATVGQRVLVLGGLEDHLPAPTVAEFLADQGKSVEVVSELMTVGQGIESATQYLLTKRLLEKEVTLSPLTGVLAIRGGTVVVRNTFTRRERRIEGIDTVVLACGGRSNTQLARALKGRVKELHSIGDCLAPRRILSAVLDGSRAGRLL